MDAQEREHMLASSAMHALRESTPGPFDDPYSEMTSEEKSRLLILQQRMCDDYLRRAEEAESRSAMLMAKVDELLSGQGKVQSDLSSLIRQLAEKDRRIEELTKALADKDQQLALRNRHTFGRKSQKHSGKKKDGDDEPPRQKDKEDFDGTPESVSLGKESDGHGDSSGGEKGNTKEDRPYRTGMTYRTMCADETVSHMSDLRRLPAGATVVRFARRYSYEQVSKIVEHSYQIIVYKLNGQMHGGYFPAEGEPEIIDVVPGTHASADFMAYLAFNSYVLDTPAYREIQRIMAERMRVSRMTLTNWLHKGSLLATGIVNTLKDMCLEKDSIVNCDETWCRVRVEDRYRRRYIWCLVNKNSRL